MRHGEALSNVRKVISSWPETFENPLTPRGIQMIQESAKTSEDKHIDYIFASPLLRTTQTATIVANHLKLKVESDTRLREVGFGVLSGKPISDLNIDFSDEKKRINECMPEGETYQQVMERMKECLMEINSRYEHKTILLVSHECPLWILEATVSGMSLEQYIETVPKDDRIHKGQVKKLIA